MKIFKNSEGFFFTKIIVIDRLLVEPLSNLSKMILYINTASQTDIEIGLKIAGEFVFKNKLEAERAQAEKLLPAIENILKKNHFKLKDIRAIEVENSGGSFTSLRIGVATANALGLALGVPVRGTVGQSKKVGKINIVEPIYDREPDIGSHNT